MVAGHLRERNGIYHIVLNYSDEYGRKKTIQRSTKLPVKGNKKRAEELLNEARKEIENNTFEKKKANGINPNDKYKGITFTDFLKEWLNIMGSCVEITTYSAYESTVLKKIVPFFDEKYPGLLLTEIEPRHIQDFYTYELMVKKLSTNTIIHRHANIRKALQYAFQLGLLNFNPADRVQRPKKKQFTTTPYDTDEIECLCEKIRGTNLELAVILAAFYGLRRGEIVGLKWSAIDFKRKTITIKHTVTQAVVDGKRTVIEKDSPKTKSSNRCLPLMKNFEDLLILIKEKQSINMMLCGNCYNKDYLEYIYVNELGERIMPGYITQAFPKFLKDNNMRPIRFHDLRHSCASLLYKNGVPLKNIQEWLGHSDINTTSNIYTHLDYNSKLESANAIEGLIPEYK